MGANAILCRECGKHEETWEGCAHVVCPKRVVLSAQVRDEVSSDPCVVGTYRAEPHIDGDDSAY